jgi:hypothetical protein
MEIAPQTAKRRSTTQNKIGKQLLWVYSKWAWSGGTRLRIVPCCAREHRCENHAYPVQRSRASNGQRLRRPGGPDPNRNTNVKAPSPMPIKTVWPLWNFACGGQAGFFMCRLAVSQTTKSARKPPIPNKLTKAIIHFAVSIASSNQRSKTTVRDR